MAIPNFRRDDEDYDAPHYDKKGKEKDKYEFMRGPLKIKKERVFLKNVYH